MQTRLQGRIFMCPTFSEQPKESNVSMRRNPVPVSIPMLWPCTSPTCFHKTPKDPHSPSKKDMDTHSNLFGRHNDYWQDKRRDYGSTRYSHSFTSVPGICYKSEKVSDDTSSGDRISGNDSQFKGNDYFPSTEKTTVNKTDVSGFVSESRDNSFRVNKGVRLPDINNFGHYPSKTPLSFSQQQQQIQALKKNGFHENQVLLNKESQLDLFWWVKIIELYNGRTLIQLPAQALLQTDAWGAVWEGMKTGGTWTEQERRVHIKELELLALKLALETFLKAQEIKSLYIQMDNIMALTYFLKMGGTKNLQMVCLSKQIWKLLLRKKVTVTADHLPSALKKHADIESRRKTDSSEWKLAP